MPHKIPETNFFVQMNDLINDLEELAKYLEVFNEPDNIASIFLLFKYITSFLQYFRLNKSLSHITMFCCLRI